MRVALAKHKHRTRLVLRPGPAVSDIYFLGDSITEYWPEIAPDLWRGRVWSTASSELAAFPAM